MKDDALDEMTDAQLNELFAVEVAGARKDGNLFIDSEGAIMVPRSYNYCASADAVLPWLHVAQDPEVYFFEKDVRVTITTRPREGRSYHQWVDGEAATFARAAVIALIRAKRAAK